jgi:hypothetical protein
VTVSTNLQLYIFRNESSILHNFLYQRAALILQCFSYVFLVAYSFCLLGICQFYVIHNMHFLTFHILKQQNALNTIKHHKTYFILGASSYMFQHQGAIFREFINNKGLSVQHNFHKSKMCFCNSKGAMNMENPVLHS